MEDFHRSSIFCLPAFTCTSYQILKGNTSRSKGHENTHKCYLSALVSSSFHSRIKLHETHLRIAEVYHLHSITFVLLIKINSSLLQHLNISSGADLPWMELRIPFLV